MLTLKSQSLLQLERQKMCLIRYFSSAVQAHKPNKQDVDIEKPKLEAYYSKKDRMSISFNISKRHSNEFRSKFFKACLKIVTLIPFLGLEDAWH